MSIPVDVAELGDALARHGSGHLLTTALEGPGAGRVKAVTVDPVLADGVLRVTGPGRGTLANVGGNAAVTLLFPPLEQHGYALLVDGTGAVDGEDVVVTPTAAVLHRPRHHAEAAGHAPDAPHDGCGHDCAPVGG